MEDESDRLLLCFSFSSSSDHRLLTFDPEPVGPGIHVGFHPFRVRGQPADDVIKHGGSLVQTVVTGYEL